LDIGVDVKVGFGVVDAIVTGTNVSVGGKRVTVGCGVKVAAIVVGVAGAQLASNKIINIIFASFSHE